MKRRSFLVAASASAAALTTRPWSLSEATAESRSITGPEVAVRDDLAYLATTVSGVTVDGTLDDPRWGDPVRSGFSSLYDLDPTDSVTLRVVHDRSSLYLGVEVVGATARTLTYLTVLLRTEPGRCWVATVEIRPASLPMTFEWGGPTTEISGHRSAARVADSLTTCTVAIPLAAVGLTGDPAGLSIGLNVVVDHDDMTAPTATSTPARTSVNRHRGRPAASATTEIVDEDRFATVHLGSVPPVSDGRGVPSLAPIGPSTVEYVGFTTKRLHLVTRDEAAAATIAVAWRAPGGEWTNLDNVVQLGAERTVELTHPAPTARGQYQLRLDATYPSGADRVSYLTFDRKALIDAGDRLPSNRRVGPRGDGNVTPEAPTAEVTALIEMVPDRAGFRFCGVPDAPALHPDKVFTFDPGAPDQLVAKATGTVYPNDQYPEDKAITVVNELGDEVSYPYHEDSEGKRYFLSAHLWHEQREHVYGSLPVLATKDPLGAARLLYRLAQRYRGWVPTNEYPWFNRPVDPHSTPRNFYWGGSLTRWSISDLSAMTPIGRAMLDIEQTDALDVLSEEEGVDVRAVLVEKFMEPSVDWSRTFPLRYSNMDSHRNNGLAMLAKALGDSSYLHEVVEWAADYSKLSFLFDGFWKETTVSYHNQSAGGAITVARTVDGWSDPKGYESPRSGLRITDLDLMERMPVLQASQRVPKLMAYPDTHVLPVADTWASERASDPETRTRSVLLGASGIARLGRGETAGEGPFGEVSGFVDLPIVEQTVPVKYFAGSRTMQVEANANGAEVTWEFTVAALDHYDIDIVPFHAESYGQYEISVDSVVVGEHDFYAESAGAKAAFTVIRRELTAGKHTITFRGVGKRSESSNYKMGVVSLALLDEQAREDRDTSEAASGNPSQVYLTFTPKYGHNHWDPLNIDLWAEGQELLPDIGYTHTLYGRWTRTTLGHNTVTVDGDDMDSDAGVDGGSLEVFDHADESVQVMRADYGTAYPQTHRYIREVWSIAHPDTTRDEGYVLDLFRVAGGSRHELSFNGDANRDAEMTTAATLTDHGPYLLPAGVEGTEPTRETETGSAEGHYYGYIYVRDVKRAELTDGRFDVALTTSNDDGPGSHARIHGLAGAGTELFLGRSPSMRATRLHGTSGDINSEATKWTMPKMVLRREGSDLRSNFVTVVEPAAASSDTRIDTVEQLSHDGGVDDLAIKVTYLDGTTDVVISSLTGDGTVTAAGVSLTGKHGWVRMSAGAVRSMRLVGGTALTAGGQTLEGSGAVTGSVTGTRRRMSGEDMNALVTDVDVPDWAVGRTVVVTHPTGKTHGYSIKAVHADGGSSLLELDRMDPGFVIDGDSSAMVFTPFTTWEGRTTFRIENSMTG